MLVSGKMVAGQALSETWSAVTCGMDQLPRMSNWPGARTGQAEIVTEY